MVRAAASNHSQRSGVTWGSLPHSFIGIGAFPNTDPTEPPNRREPWRSLYRQSEAIHTRRQCDYRRLVRLKCSALWAQKPERVHACQCQFAYLAVKRAHLGRLSDHCLGKDAHLNNFHPFPELQSLRCAVSVPQNTKLGRHRPKHASVCNRRLGPTE